MRLLKATIISIFLLGCNSPAQQEREYIEFKTHMMSDDLLYFKDDRTNTCFAGLYVGANYGAMSGVPCTPEVEKASHHFTSRR